MTLKLSHQPWVRPQVSRLPRASSLEEGLTAVIAAGDCVELWSDADGMWLDGVVEEVDDLQCASALGTPKSSIKIRTRSSAKVVPSDEAVSVIRKSFRISLVAPGGGVDGNGSVYRQVDDLAAFQVDVVGRKSTLYDRYPEDWQGGGAAPNLASFGRDLLRMGIHERTDCFIFGSRGGQVVLPSLWKALGDAVPPCVVINGGCAMNLPGPRVAWPRHAVTVMLCPGQDFFRGARSSDEYLQSACGAVAADNCTTAILYVPEMKHMPQQEMLAAVLPHLLRLALSWRRDRNQVPLQLLQAPGFALAEQGWGARLLFTAAPGRWQQMHFGPQEPDRPAEPLSPRAPRPERPPPVKALGTAVAVLPMARVASLKPAEHRALAAQAEQEATALLRSSHKEADLLRRRLLEFAAGQEGEAYAAEGDLANEQARKAFKQKQSVSQNATVSRGGQPGMMPMRSPAWKGQNMYHQALRPAACSQTAVLLGAPAASPLQKHVYTGYMATPTSLRGAGMERILQRPTLR